MILITTQIVYACASLVMTWNVWKSYVEQDKPESKQILNNSSNTIVYDSTAEKIKERAGDALEWTKDKAQDAVDWTKDKTHDAADWAKEKASHTQNTASDIFTRLRRRLIGISQVNDARRDTQDQDLVQVRVLPNEYVLFVDVAGIPSTKLHAQVAKNQLLLYGEHEECVAKACWERSVEEVFELPEDVLPDSIESYVHLQVLVVKIPRKTLDADREIKISQKGTLDKLLGKVGLD